MGADFAGIAQRDNPRRAFCPHLNDFLRSQNFCAETLRLSYRPSRQVRSAQAGGETQIILDARTASGLAARRFAFDEQGL